MKKHFLNPNTLLGRVVAKNKRYEIVHLSLKKGNEIPEYKNSALIVIFVINGSIKLITENEEAVLNSLEMAEIASEQAHKMEAFEDSQVVAFKIYG